ncbi:hypothetical protein [Nocardia lijiangensis]|uniref:hypothetical protein n=1 Tax=Nocardia lijiangensis TaxID=299618 RepID=UPI003D7106D8
MFDDLTAAANWTKLLDRVGRLSFVVTGTMFAACIAAFGAGNGLADTGDPIIESKKLLADPVAPDGSKIVSSSVDGRNLTLQVYSAAMDNNITQIPATFDYAPAGTHSWGYWRDAFYKSWPMLAEGLGIPA